MKFSEEIIERLCKHLKQGSTVKSACAAVGIAKATFYEWKESKPDFSDTINEAMAIPDRKVENSLYKSATGFYYTEIEYKMEPSKDGLKLKKIPVRKIRKFVQPIVVAQKFILINRNPDEWRDRQEHDVAVKMNFDFGENGE